MNTPGQAEVQSHGQDILLPTRDTPVADTSGRRTARGSSKSALEEALCLLGFNPDLVCHFLWSKKAQGMRLALAHAIVDIPQASHEPTAPEAASLARRCLEAVRLDSKAPPESEKARA
jgi:hypothetical protein